MMQRQLQRISRAAAALAWNGSAVPSHRIVARHAPVYGHNAPRCSMLTIAAAAATTVGVTASVAFCEAPAKEDGESGYKENPLQHVAALLRLYDEIDRNMEVLANRMLENLQTRVEKEKKENDGKLTLSPEQIALHMSIEFESTLESVQHAVFRNNYVTKEHVRDALARMVKGELRGSGPRGQLTVQEAEAIEGYVKRLERLRWKVTGSREPLLPTQRKALVKQAAPEIPLETVVQVMETLIPTLTTEMETIARDVRAAHSDLSAAQQHQRIAAAYIKRSGELTEAVCNARQLDLRAFQAALIFYHDDPVFEKALARLSADQQRRFAALGL